VTSRPRDRGLDPQAQPRRDFTTTTTCDFAGRTWTDVVETWFHWPPAPPDLREVLAIIARPSAATSPQPDSERQPEAQDQRQRLVHQASL